MMGNEAEAMLKRLSSRLITKCWQSYSWTCGYVQSSVAIIIVRTTHHYIQGYQVSASRIGVHHTQGEDSASLHIYRFIG